MGWSKNYRRAPSAKLPWPAPAVLVWLGAWGLFYAALGLGVAYSLALVLASGFGGLLSFWGATWWRRGLIASGFPVSLALSLPAAGLAALPAWVWLVPLVVLLLMYPLSAWRDAPLFPTPRNALGGLTSAAPLPPAAKVLDAGCGLGHGLQALRIAYPHAQLHGAEWSWLLRWACARRCPWAHVRRANIWRMAWEPYQMVYLFQRPESMQRAVSKANAELQPGAWLVSLEFEATHLISTTQIQTSSGKMLWLYQAPFKFKDSGDR
jgi:hypothetical protein